MDSKTLQVARSWAKAGLCDATIAAKIRSEHRALVLKSIAPGGLSSITQAQKNGMMLTKSSGLSVPDTMTAFGRAIEWLDLGYIPQQSRSLGRFF